jgi:hypothetical protein
MCRRICLVNVILNDIDQSQKRRKSFEPEYQHSNLIMLIKYILIFIFSYYGIFLISIDIEIKQLTFDGGERKKKFLIICFMKPHHYQCNHSLLMIVRIIFYHKMRHQYNHSIELTIIVWDCYLTIVVGIEYEIFFSQWFFQIHSLEYVCSSILLAFKSSSSSS